MIVADNVAVTLMSITTTLLLFVGDTPQNGTTQRQQFRRPISSNISSSTNEELLIESLLSDGLMMEQHVSIPEKPLGNISRTSPDDGWVLSNNTASFSASSPILTKSMNPIEWFERLPNFLKPIQYKLCLSLDSELDLIKGQVQIELQCRHRTSLVQLHLSPDFVSVEHLFLHSKWLNRTIPIESTETDWRRQILRIRLGEEITRGHVFYLGIWFSARYSDDGRGLTRQWDMARGLWLNSLFEPTFARRLFPCFDEPKFRSSFSLELWLWNELASEGYVALSNTDSNCSRWHSNLSICTFGATPPIPSYLFTLAVGRFRSVCNRSEMPLLETDACIWRLLEVKDEWEKRALEVIDAMTQFQAGMSDYLLADPVARLHMLVVPMKVKINGMENFGLLNVREQLWPSQNDSSASLRRFEKTLFHEMTHQWFGNLVTPVWWDCIWLSESVTTFLSSARPIVFDPALDLSGLALVNDSWAVNSEKSTLGVTIPRILYTKGAVLLEMLDSLIGPHNMQRLFRDLIRHFQFDSIDTKDFLTILGRVLHKDNKLSSPPTTDLPVFHFMDKWLHLPSHPIVFVDFDPQLRQLCLSQTPKIASAGHRQLWPVPVWIECLEGTVPEAVHWIPDEDNAQLVIPLHQLTRTNSSRSLAFNRNRSVYYELTMRIRQH